MKPCMKPSDEPQESLPLQEKEARSVLVRCGPATPTSGYCSDFRGTQGPARPRRKPCTCPGPVRLSGNSVPPQRVNGAGICSRAASLGRGRGFPRSFLRQHTQCPEPRPGFLAPCGPSPTWGKVCFLINAEGDFCDSRGCETPVCWWAPEYGFFRFQARIRRPPETAASLRSWPKSGTLSF